MKIRILLILISSLISCKKEAEIVNSKPKDSTFSLNNFSQDSIKLKQPQYETFAFVTELCDNKGKFDAAKHSRKELEGTYKLWFENGGASINTASVYDTNSLQKVRRDKDIILAKLDKDFTEVTKTIENLTLVNIPYWQNVKAAHIRELKEDYDKSRLQIISYSDPRVLINNKFTGNCKNFAKALNSNDEEMIAEWQKLREEMSKRNGDPEGIMNEFENHLNSSNWKEYAVIDLITFGWGNCANADIERPQHDEKMNKEFEDLFVKIDSECDEP